ncbi:MULTISPECIES: methyltransferase domain-containing protein [Acidithiobacillus]|uniref:Ribosomal RNA small subunit methyltransferase A n=2 Tax=Acidithiobacillus ferridurans TaxID=1232575 RepID=A0A2Z6IIT7_ACIFI|nr:MULTISPECIES: methyltransferase domain-containing protein [Acidithiobacillus]MBU2716991.1 methyltransferase domain-containing protein [Acidithiobacillus ferridurans]MBU2720241.1 methyltransferase domain-containing protein [Acidithiobacillus ferridurans]MBU2722949.1 methyltransferase domain-containing protein [Acidithiobacillus ferridurans]MBU2726830.1 methyltransferase domain-containing protein [Acidithiobacillus ferridurans]MBU2733544.1 methyltransferase domain-containing protein [Acidithi
MSRFSGPMSQAWHFTREFLRDPHAIGAVLPSSPFLARRMATMVPQGSGLVVELGPGMGPVTKALLESGIPPEDLVLVEQAPTMVRHLRQRYPEIEVIEGDAAHIQHLVAHRGPVRAVVSSLPLRSIPKTVVERIFQQLPGISRPGTVFIQFTYHFRTSCQGLPAEFRRSRVAVVWRNVPPARVDTFIYHSPQKDGFERDG